MTGKLLFLASLELAALLGGYELATLVAQEIDPIPSEFKSKISESIVAVVVFSMLAVFGFYMYRRESSFEKRMADRDKDYLTRIDDFERRSREGHAARDSQIVGIIDRFEEKLTEQANQLERTFNTHTKLAERMTAAMSRMEETQRASREAFERRFSSIEGFIHKWALEPPDPQSGRGLNRPGPASTDRPV